MKHNSKRKSHPAGPLDKKLSRQAYHPQASENADPNAKMHSVDQQKIRPQTTHSAERSNPANGGRHQ